MSPAPANSLTVQDAAADLDLSPANSPTIHSRILLLILTFEKISMPRGQQHTYNLQHTDIATTRLNRSRGRFSKNTKEIFVLWCAVLNSNLFCLAQIYSLRYVSFFFFLIYYKLINLKNCFFCSILLSTIYHYRILYSTLLYNILLHCGQTVIRVGQAGYQWM